MTTHNTFGKAAIGALALATVALALAPSGASAQTYRAPPSNAGPNGYYYDGCQRAESNRQVGGGLAGAVAGAVIGGNVASRNARDEGAVLGGLLGAVVGSQIGRSTAACQSNGYNSYEYGYDANRGYGAYPQTYDERVYDERAYDDRYAYTPQPYYDQRAGRQAQRQSERRYERRAPGYEAYEYPVAQQQTTTDPQGCTIAESPVLMPDGRTQTRMVRVCRDSRGQYQIVD